MRSRTSRFQTQQIRCTNSHYKIHSGTDLEFQNLGLAKSGEEATRRLAALNSFRSNPSFCSMHRSGKGSAGKLHQRAQRCGVQRADKSGFRCRQRRIEPPGERRHGQKHAANEPARVVLRRTQWQRQELTSKRRSSGAASLCQSSPTRWRRQAVDPLFARAPGSSARGR